MNKYEACWYQLRGYAKITGDDLLLHKMILLENMHEDLFGKKQNSSNCSMEKED